MSSKAKNVFVCGQCGYESPKWNGCCPGCGEWNCNPLTAVRGYRSHSSPLPTGLCLWRLPSTCGGWSPLVAAALHLWRLVSTCGGWVGTPFSPSVPGDWMGTPFPPSVPDNWAGTPFSPSVPDDWMGTPFPPSVPDNWMGTPFPPAERSVMADSSDARPTLAGVPTQPVLLSAHLGRRPHPAGTAFGSPWPASPPCRFAFNHPRRDSPTRSATTPL